jgi:hypothetical protein
MLPKMRQWHSDMVQSPHRRHYVEGELRLKGIQGRWEWDGLLALWVCFRHHVKSVHS